MRSGRRGRVGSASLVSLLLLVCLSMDAVAELVFRVPEVLAYFSMWQVQVRNASAIPVGSLRPPGPPGPPNPLGPPVNRSEHHIRYEEYFVEHEISTADARKAAQELNLDDVPSTRPGCGTCSRRDLEYCETRVLYDHCCCERRFLPEPFPWLPHTCYIGPHRCRPLAKDCVRYTRLRDCCCYKKLAERWKAILSKSNVSSASVSLLAVSLLLTCFSYLQTFSYTTEHWAKHGYGTI